MYVATKQIKQSAVSQTESFLTGNTDTSLFKHNKGYWYIIINSLSDSFIRFIYLYYSLTRKFVLTYLEPAPGPVKRTGWTDPNLLLVEWDSVAAAVTYYVKYVDADGTEHTTNSIAGLSASIPCTNNKDGSAIHLSHYYVTATDTSLTSIPITFLCAQGTYISIYICVKYMPSEISVPSQKLYDYIYTSNSQSLGSS